MNEPSTQGLSPIATKLAEQCGMNGDVSAALKVSPELMPGLDEYLKWRDSANQDKGKTIVSKSRTPLVKHELSAALKKLPKPKRAKK